jgi:hypothetical protein
MHRIAVRHRRNEPQIDAAQAQHVLLFLGLRLRHHDDGAVAARIADEREADAGVAGGALDDDAARLEQPPLLGVLDDLERGAVLDGAAGVQKLGFAENRTAGLLRGPTQFDERGVADRANKAVTDLHIFPH